MIRDRYFTKDGIRFKPSEFEVDETHAFVAYVLDEQSKYELKQFGLPGKDGAIPSQGEFIIADIEFPSLTAAQRDQVVQKAGDIEFHVDYESMYGEKYTLKAT